MNEPACERCGKKYYENMLEVEGNGFRCISCRSTVKDRRRNFISQVYYRFKCEYGLTMLGRFQSLFITALFLLLLLSFVTKTAKALMFVARMFVLCAKFIRLVASEKAYIIAQSLYA